MAKKKVETAEVTENTEVKKEDIMSKVKETGKKVGKKLLIAGGIGAAMLGAFALGKHKGQQASDLEYLSGFEPGPDADTSVTDTVKTTEI